MRSKHVIVVGAGPGGLASAMLLAASGARVTVVDRLPHVGGRTSTFQNQGFTFDLGPTFFLYPRVLEDVFAAVGRNLHREVKLIRLDPQYRLVFGAGGAIDATGDIAAMQRQIAALSPVDAPAFKRFIDDNRAKLTAFRPILESPFNSWRDLLSPAVLRAAPFVRPWRSLDRELRAYFTDPRIRLAFSFQSKYLGMSPFQCPSLFSILSFLEYEHGVYHPVGGCGAVSHAMARVAKESGVEFRLGEPVEELLFEGRRAVGVRTPRESLRADAVVVNADFAHAMRTLVPDRLRRRWTDERIEKKKFSCSTFMMYLGVDRRVEELPHHTIFMSKGYEENLTDIESRHVLSKDPSFYVQNACVTDDTLAPAGRSSLYVLLPVTHEHANVDWRRETPAFRALALRQLEKIGLRDIESRIVCERIITPELWRGDLAIHRGATFNLAHNLGQMLHLRPRNRFEDLEAVYLTGGGTHPGSGLPVIYESARITTRLIAQDLGLRFPTPTPAASPACSRTVQLANMT